MNRLLLYAGSAGIVIVSGIFFIPRHYAFPENYEKVKIVSASSTFPKALEKTAQHSEHLRAPESVKGIYMTSWIASTQTRRDELVDLVDSTTLNTIVIDIKDDTGRVSFDVKNETIQKEGSIEVRVRDMPEFIRELHAKNIYAIGRIAVFQDPYYANIHPDRAVHFASTGAPWQDRKGQMWIDASGKEFWKYIVALAQSSYEAGFDEIQFDYVRFPSDGNVDDIAYPLSGEQIANNPRIAKIRIMESFFSYLSENLRPSIPISADIFGVAVTDQGDNGIGQQYEKILPYFDYVSPMVYPSHFGAGYEGYPNPAEHPYEVTRTSIGKAVARKKVLQTSTSTASEIRKKVKNSGLRPWLQDFDLGADYSAPMVATQIRALNELSVDSWLLWNASNHYTEGVHDSE